jgi:hypothetical protein
MNIGDKVFRAQSVNAVIAYHGVCSCNYSLREICMVAVAGCHATMVHELLISCAFNLQVD